MSARAKLFALTWVLLLFVLAPLTCRKATGSEEDPLLVEAREHFAAYLRIDTSNPPGNETAGARYLQQLLTKEGIDAKLIGSDPARQSVYARLVSGSKEKALVLLHHIDVVPPVAAEWTKPPFSGDVSDGYIWGRGALDIKSLGIAELMAMIDLHRRKVALRRDIIFLAVADEEMGGAKGCKELLEKHPELFADVGFVLNEGGYNETAVDRVMFWGIEVQQKVPLWLRLHVEGEGGHSASPPDNGGTLMNLVRAIEAVQQIPMPYRLTPSVERHLHELGSMKKDYRGDTMRALHGAVDVARVEKTLTPGYRALLRDTLAVTRIIGGTSVNAIPATAFADLDIRLLPDERPEPMIARVKETVKEKLGSSAEVEMLLEGEPVPESSHDTELFRVLTAEMKKVEPESGVAAVVGAGTSDSRFFRARGITAYGIAPFKVNYYDASSVHGTNERIRSRFFSEGVTLTRRIVESFCVREE